MQSNRKDTASRTFNVPADEHPTTKPQHSLTFNFKDSQSSRGNRQENTQLQQNVRSAMLESLTQSQK